MAAAATRDDGHGWIARVNAFGVAAVAAALGLDVRERHPSADARPCPACGAELRSAGRHDRRGPIGVRADDSGWTCHACKATGDPLDLAAWRIVGTKARAAGPRLADVRAWCAGAGLCEPDAGRSPATRGGPAVELRPLPAPRPPAPPAYPPAGEVAELWTAAVRVDCDDEAAAWVRSRGLDVGALADRDLARVLPPGAALPRWAHWRDRDAPPDDPDRPGRPWTATGHRLIVPWFDAGGALRSVRARYIGEGKPYSKAASPLGCEARGLVFADALGRELLRAGPPPWFDATASEGEHGAALWVHEGEPDFLTRACVVAPGALAGDAAAELQPAVWGFAAGGPSEALAARIPRGWRVMFAQHDDAGGDTYRRAWYALLLRAVENGQIPPIREWYGAAVLAPDGTPERLKDGRAKRHDFNDEHRRALAARDR